MTVCPAFGDAFDKSIVQAYNTTSTLVRRGQYPKGIKSSMDFFNEVTRGLDDLVDTIKVETLASVQDTGLRKFIFTSDPDAGYGN